MVQENNPVVHSNSPMPNPTSVTKASVGNRKAAGATALRGVTRTVHSLGSR